METSSVLDPPRTVYRPTRRRPVPSSRRKPLEWKSIALYAFAAIAAGAFHAVAWVFPGNWYAAWIGQAAFIFLAAVCVPRQAFLLGFLGGVVGIAASFHWGIAALRMTIDANLPLAYAIFSVLVAFEGLSFGIFCGLVSLARQRSRAGLWLTPFVWAAIEVWYPRLFPWQLGYSQLEILPLLQIAEWTGSVGVGFVVTAAAAIPAAVYLGWRKTATFADRRFAVRYCAVAIAILATTLIHGGIRQGQWSRRIAEQPKIKVAAVQVDPAFAGSELALRRLTLPLRDHVDLICWPESSLGVYSEDLAHFRDRALTAQLSRGSFDHLEPAKDFGRHFLAGGKAYRPDAGDNGPYTMTAYLIGPNQDILGRYQKRTLLPFGEYVPGQSFYPAVREWFTLYEVIEAGSDPSPLVTEQGHKLGVLVCYEDTQPKNARQTVALGGEALFSLIQGTAFENALTLKQHQRLAAMRAVENRRYFVRCASTGITCIIAPTGEIVGELPVQHEGVLLGEIALLKHRTIYSRLGDSFGWLCTAVVVCALLLGRRGLACQQTAPN